jgi:hypothetical protein
LLLGAAPVIARIIRQQSDPSLGWKKNQGFHKDKLCPSECTLAALLASSTTTAGSAPSIRTDKVRLIRSIDAAGGAFGNNPSHGPMRVKQTIQSGTTDRHGSSRESMQ